MTCLSVLIGTFATTARGGRLGQLGELGPDEGCAEQGVRVGVDDQLRPAVEAVAEDGEIGDRFGVARWSS